MPGTPYETTNLTPEEITRLIAETLANMLVAGIRQQQIADRQNRESTASCSYTSASECSRCCAQRPVTILRPIPVRPPAPVVRQTNSDDGELSLVESSPGPSSSLDGQFLYEDEIQDINTWVDETGVTEHLRYADLVRTRAGIANVPNNLTQRRAAVANTPTNIMQIRRMQAEIGNKIKHSK